ncbi:MAG: LuxR family transcriptional regulator, partial [Acidimicrobiia bacterium]|nr:LuxR family transcriptional regulator [Acidimicrobiia bacterium]
MDTDWPLTGRTAEKDTLARAVARGRSVIVAGTAGVGKTRLVEDVVSGISPKRVCVHRVIATGASSDVPLGALARVFSIAESSSASMIIGMNEARTRLISEAGDRQLLVWVDNANLLDDASVETLTQMAMAGEAQVVVTLRNDEPVPQPITMLWKERIADRIEIEPLTESATRALIEDVLDGPV